MTLQNTIETQLQSSFSPSYLFVENESFRHSVPKGSETHFKIVLVSSLFEGKALLARHRSVNASLANVIPQVRALSLHTFTPDEWEREASNKFDSPLCHGGSKNL